MNVLLYLRDLLNAEFVMGLKGYAGYVGVYRTTYDSWDIQGYS